MLFSFISLLSLSSNKLGDPHSSRKQSVHPKWSQEEILEFPCNMVVVILLLTLRNFALKVEDAISKFKHLHGELEVTPSAASYEKLIGHCCDLLQAHAALSIVDQMFEVGLALPIETFDITCMRGEL
ncbi:hypothetical protein TEA_005999 [Camellia sinensis var. sinensis]|uniref:Pentatricopeptide repeat-containing protein n=1 Tax=Camellia sinensis var. sinensis TaxID=542762 RepID=A0A4S4D7U6_CAMSN|nr:hypothetical protein TEA_005999 [Camellia sinensis var. sinensis]